MTHFKFQGTGETTGGGGPPLELAVLALVLVAGSGAVVGIAEAVAQLIMYLLAAVGVIVLAAVVGFATVSFHDARQASVANATLLTATGQLARAAHDAVPVAPQPRTETREPNPITTTTDAAPRCSKQSVKPPVDAPTSIARAPSTEIAK